MRSDIINLLCKSGEFYKEFEYVRYSEVMGIDDRHKLKRDFCQAFFNYESCFIKHPFSHAFFKKFPRSWLVVRDLKKKYECDWHIPPNKRHSQLACRLQQMESNCVIDGVIGGLIEDNVDIPVITIHDGILTTKPHIENIKQRIKHSFLQRYGLEVGLTIKL